MFQPHEFVSLAQLVQHPDFQDISLQNVLGEIGDVLRHEGVQQMLGPPQGMRLCIFEYVPLVTSALYQQIQQSLAPLKRPDFPNFITALHKIPRHFTLFCTPHVPLDEVTPVFTRKPLKPNKYWLGVIDNVTPLVRQ